MSRCQFISLVLVAVGFLHGMAVAQNKSAVTIKGWGSVVDPDGDCKLAAESGKLSITVPGTPHDLSVYYPNSNAPRVLQEVEGDFTVEVRVSGEFDPGDSPAVPGRNAFNGAGLLIFQDGTNYVRFERNVWVTPTGIAVSYTPLLEHWKDSKQVNAAQRVRNVKERPYFEGRSTHLKLQRKGEKVLASLSHNGKDWIEVKELATGFPKKVQVGVLAINTSKKPLVVEFDGLKLTRVAQ